MQSDPRAGDARTRVLSPWNGIFGWVGMCILILLSVLPMLSWNYQLLVPHRGLPRSMAFEEIEGDQRFIRGM
jgi:ABC-type Fe3+ transport system permease subunit